MDGRDFLDSARRMAQGTTEPDWRTAAGRAYYAIMLEGRDALARWGITPQKRDPIHSFVRLRFAFANHPVLKQIGDALEQLGQLRGEADYRLATPGSFVDAQEALDAILDAADAIGLLDHIESDPARRTAAIAAIKKAFPP